MEKKKKGFWSKYKSFEKDFNDGALKISKKIDKAVPALGWLTNNVAPHMEAAGRALKADRDTIIKGFKGQVKQVGREMRMPHGTSPKKYKIVSGALGFGSIGMISDQLKRGRSKIKQKKRKVPDA